MFVYNNCKHDARVLKEAKTLAMAGYDVTIIAVLDKETKSYEEKDGFHIVRVEKDPIHYRILRAAKNFNLLGIFKTIKKLLFKTSSIMTKTSVSKKGLFLNQIQSIYRKIEKIGIRKFYKTEIKRNPGRFFATGWFSLGIYGIYRPARILWYRYLRKGYYWGIYRPARILWYRYLRKGYLQGLKRALMSFHKPLSYWDYYMRSFKIISKNPGDIYHAHDLNTLPVAFLAKRRFGGKIIYDSHELYTEISTLSFFERYFAFLGEKFIIGQADAVITVNESIANELEQRYGICKPTVIMNCPFKKENLSQSKILSQVLNLDKNIKIILYQGGFSPYRGLENLILATRYFLSEYILVLMGWGKLEKKLKALVRKSHLSNKVYFLNPVPQDVLLEYTASAHIGVIPYQYVNLNNYYTTPNKLFEYINAGIPVVGSNFPELKRIIEGYNIGCTFNPEDPKDIARAICEVLKDPEKYEQMRRNSREAAEIFNWENESKKLLALYRGLEEKGD